MKPISEFIRHLEAQNVALTVVDGTLKCSAPKGVLSADLRAELAARKPALIAWLTRAPERVSIAGDDGIPRVERTQSLPLSFAQQRLWFLHQLDPLDPAYNIGAAIRLRGPLDTAALKGGLGACLARHESLRTVFVHEDGAPRAIIRPSGAPDFEILDVAAAAPDDRALEVEAARLVRKPFDLARGPLLRATLLALAPGDALLVLAIHHIVFDGWSAGVFLRDLAECYRALSTGGAPDLPALPIQYADFAAWHRSVLENGVLAGQLSYWAAALAGAPPMLPLPTETPKESAGRSQGARAVLTLPADLTGALTQLGRTCQATLFMTLLAAFKVLLFRYTHEADVVVGSASANRGRLELNNLVGFFVNNLVLRTSLAGSPTFRELLGRVRDTCLAAFDHADVPFDRLVQALRPERSLEISPLFQVMFTLQNFPYQEFELAGVRAEPFEFDAGIARFDLSVEIYPRGGELWVYFDYNRDRWAAATINRMQQHFRTLLGAVVAHPEEPVDRLPLLSEAERGELLGAWQGPALALPPEDSFLKQFEIHAALSPDALAVRAGTESLSYRELNGRANELSRLLESRGVGREQLVAVFVDRSVHLPIALLGVLKAGAAYVPLDPIYPAERIAAILDDARPAAILSLAAYRDLLPAGAIEVVLLDRLPAERFSAANLALPVAGDQLAYVIFTSGSTGKPKGVEISHRALFNFLASMRREPAIEPGETLLAVTTVSFDIAALELLLPLFAGANVHLASEPANPAVLLREWAASRPAVMQGTPATWRMLLAAGWPGDPQLKILCGGEALPPDLALSLLARCRSLWNMYGPTETTIWSAALPVTPADALEPSVPIGGPIDNTYFYILDEARQPVPFGVPGELHIGGAGLARGYLHRAALTAERFVPDLFSDGRDQARLYRTGDTVRARPDRKIEFLGRVDQQVKLRGYRIELGEIEHALRSHPGVGEAAVVLREDGLEKQLVAYLTASNGHRPERAEVFDRLRERLPAYMVPARLVFLEALPRLPNGKLNRAALPAIDRSAPSVAPAAAVPSSDLERTVSQVFCELLQVSDVSPAENFFDLGAHSLLLVEAHEILKRRVDADLTLVHFFQYPSVRALAGFLAGCAPAQVAEAGAR